jgi:hypothetical protein
MKCQTAETKTQMVYFSFLCLVVIFSKLIEQSERY